MFVLLCIVICLATFAIAVLAGGMLTQIFSLLLHHRALQLRLIRFPTLLFALRILPWVLSGVVTLAFVLPSFLLLEPRHTSERPERYLLILAVAGALLITGVGARISRLVFKTTQLSRNWLQGARRASVCMDVPIYQVESPASLFAVTGIFRPRIFVGQRALEVLHEGELRAAIAHEMAHASSLDNLKQLILSITRIPRFFSKYALEIAWRTAAELEADRRAVRSGISPLDLGAALVKIGRITNVSESSLVGVSHFVSTGQPSTLEMRVYQLQALVIEENSLPSPELRSHWWILFGALLLIAYAATFQTSLVPVHRAIEWLVS